MGKCINHPDRETSYQCMKHGIYLCEECLECRDPNIYCKFRSSCPIWYVTKKKRSRKKEEEQEKSTRLFRVSFLPDGQSAAVEEGTTLLDAARSADVYINASCNGKGACGKCKLILESGEVKTEPTSLLSEQEKAKNYLLACKTTVHGDVTARIPEEMIERKLRAEGMGRAITDRLMGLVPKEEIRPVLKEVHLQLPVPTLDDPVSDLDRLHRGLKAAGRDAKKLNLGLNVIKEMSRELRKDRWDVVASIISRRGCDELVEIAPYMDEEKNHLRSLGLAVDIGTTSIVVYLVDMKDGQVLAATGGHNRQAACGDDVINRIVCAEKDGVKKLSKMACATINALIGEALAAAKAKSHEVKNAVIAGNTTMIHLFLGIEPGFLRREPYIPAATELPILTGKETGLAMHPKAGVFVMPSPAGYVGGDIVSGVLFSRMHRESPLTLFIDVGTNGEIVLGNADWLMTASCSAGPAFEGGGVRFGMRAEPGAIEKVEIDPDTLDPKIGIVEDAPPRGICGSGMIDLIAEMLKTGIINQAGKINTSVENPRIRTIGDEPVYVLVSAEEPDIHEDLVFTETDIENLIRSKGAVYAGFTVLLNQAGLDFSMVDRVYITGGFGRYLDVEKAVTIGLLPDISREKFFYLGNSSIQGAYMALLSEDLRKEAIGIAESMTYIDFSSNPGFMDEFTSSLFLPHTDINAFPSVIIKK